MVTLNKGLSDRLALPVPVAPVGPHGRVSVYHDGGVVVAILDEVGFWLTAKKRRLVAVVETQPKLKEFFAEKY